MLYYEAGRLLVMIMYLLIFGNLSLWKTVSGEIWSCLKHRIVGILQATDEHTNFDLHIKVARGAKEEEMKAELHRTADGKWSLKHAGPM